MKDKSRISYCNKGAFPLNEWRKEFLNKNTYYLHKKRTKFYFSIKAGTYPLCFWFKLT